MRIAIIAAAVSCMLAAAGPALASPHVVLTVPSSVNAGSPTPFTYTSSSLPRGTKLAVQRQEGTARAWRTVVSLKPTANGSGTLPALAIGGYNLRLAALRRGKVIATQQRAVKSFGTVSFAKLFPNPAPEGDAAAYCDSGPPGAYSTPSHTFSYEILSCANGEGIQTVIKVDHNTCRSIRFDYVAGVPNHESSVNFLRTTVMLTIVQERLDPVSSTSSFNAIGALDATLVPGQTWSMKAVPTGESTYLYLNGSGVCFNEEALR